MSLGTAEGMGCFPITTEVIDKGNLIQGISEQFTLRTGSHTTWAVVALCNGCICICVGKSTKT